MVWARFAMRTEASLCQWSSPGCELLTKYQRYQQRKKSDEKCGQEGLQQFFFPLVFLEIVHLHTIDSVRMDAMEIRIECIPVRGRRY